MVIMTSLKVLGVYCTCQWVVNLSVHIKLVPVINPWTYRPNLAQMLVVTGRCLVLILRSMV